MGSNEEKRVYLLQYRQNRAKLERRRGELLTHWERATAISPHYAKTPGSGGRRHDPLGQAAAAVVDLEREVAEETIQLLALRGEILDTIATLGEPLHRLVLRYRYVELLSWSEMAGRLCFSDRWVKKLHSRALGAIQTPIPALQFTPK